MTVMEPVTRGLPGSRIALAMLAMFAALYLLLLRWDTWCALCGD